MEEKFSDTEFIIRIKQRNFFKEIRKLQKEEIFSNSRFRDFELNSKNEASAGAASIPAGGFWPRDCFARFDQQLMAAHDYHAVISGLNECWEKEKENCFNFSEIILTPLSEAWPQYFESGNFLQIQKYLWVYDDVLKRGLELSESLQARLLENFETLADWEAPSNLIESGLAVFGDFFSSQAKFDFPERLKPKIISIFNRIFATPCEVTLVHNALYFLGCLIKREELVDTQELLLQNRNTLLALLEFGPEALKQIVSILLLNIIDGSQSTCWFFNKDTLQSLIAYCTKLSEGPLLRRSLKTIRKAFQRDSSNQDEETVVSLIELLDTTLSSHTVKKSTFKIILELFQTLLESLEHKQGLFEALSQEGILNCIFTAFFSYDFEIKTKVLSTLNLFIRVDSKQKFVKKIIDSGFAETIMSALEGPDVETTRFALILIDEILDQQAVGAAESLLITCLKREGLENIIEDLAFHEDESIEFLAKAILTCFAGETAD